jgi:hypothetical protein
MDISPASTLPDSSPDAPLDPDRAFTLWVLGRLAEVVEIGIRTAHRIEQQQIVAALQPGPPKADFALMQERIARAVRLSIALAARLRDAHISRKFGATTRDAAAIAAGRQQRGEAVTRIATAAIAAADAERAEFRAEALRERLAEREFENELELLPAREVLVRSTICSASRRIRISGRSTGRMRRWRARPGRRNRHRARPTHGRRPAAPSSIPGKSLCRIPAWTGLGRRTTAAKRRPFRRDRFRNPQFVIPAKAGRWNLVAV